MSDDELTLDAPQVRKLLTGFIFSQVTRAELRRAVLGLSGGLDSALACFLAAEALGPENVLAVRMPYRTSSPDSLADAQKVIDATGVRSLEWRSPPWPSRCSSASHINNTRRLNVIARLRMIVLFDQSAANDALVVGTGNKTEILLGYSTLYGDAAAAFNPLGDLYKTHVRQLAAEMVVPASIMANPPSADLFVGQTDEGDLGYTYEQIDRLLYLLVTPPDARRSRAAGLRPRWWGLIERIPATSPSGHPAIATEIRVPLGFVHVRLRLSRAPAPAAGPALNFKEPRDPGAGRCFIRPGSGRHVHAQPSCSTGSTSERIELPIIRKRSGFSPWRLSRRS